MRAKVVSVKRVVLGAWSRVGVALVVVLAAAFSYFALPAASFASSSPSIYSESASHTTEHGATLEAQINPSGLETTYAFWVEREVCKQPLPEYEKYCYGVVVGPWGEGSIAAGDSEQTVSAVVTNLEASTVYIYWVQATNSAGHTASAESRFATSAAGGLQTEGVPLPPIENHISEYKNTIGPGAAELAAAAGANQVALAVQARESAERQYKESPQYAEEQERKEVQAGEEQQRAEEAKEHQARNVSLVCVVPRLKGDSLAVARSALKKAHCRLGTVSRPRGHRAALIVTGQNHKAGTKFPHSTTIKVDLGPAALKR